MFFFGTKKEEIKSGIKHERNEVRKVQTLKKSQERVWFVRRGTASLKPPLLGGSFLRSSRLQLQLQVQGATKDNVPLDELAALFKLGLQFMVADSLGSVCDLTNELLETAESSDSRPLKSLGELLYLHKLGTLAPSKDSFHPEMQKGGGRERRVRTAMQKRMGTNTYE